MNDAPVVEVRFPIHAVPAERINPLLGELRALLGAEALVLFAMAPSGATRVMYEGPSPQESLPNSAARICFYFHRNLLELGSVTEPSTVSIESSGGDA